MQAVTALGDGFVAGGRTEDAARAVVWRSADGEHWERVPDTAAFHSESAYSAHAEVTDLVTTDTGVVAVGWNSAGNGAAVVWVSADGIEWLRAPYLPVFGGGGMMSAWLADGRLVAVGSTGWPDIHSATVWLGPPDPPTS
jgi:hypothetical protein